MNTSELNKVLSDEIYKLRSRKVKPDLVNKANAITRAASVMIAAARVELAYVKMAGVPQAVLPLFSHHGKSRVIAEQKKLAKK